MPVTTRSLFPKLTFAENSLNKYDSVDYRLRVTLLKPQDALYMDPSRGITLAESATTSRFILTDLELKQTYSLSPTARTAFFAQGVMTIMDPSGFKFMDAIVESAAKLGVTNGIINCRYLIEIEFPGYLPDGKPQIDPERGVFVVQVHKAEVRLTEKGGEFKLHFGGLDYDASRHVNVTLPKTKTIQHAGHFKNFIQELERILNEEEKLKVGRGEQQYENKWKFILEPFVSSSPHFQFTSMADNQQWRDRTQRPMDGQNGVLNSAREGSTIIQVIDNAMADTKAMQFGLNQDGTLSDPLEITTADKALEDAKKIKQMYRVDVMVDPEPKWDSITNDYVKNFYYYIFLQDAPDWFYGPVNQIKREEFQTIVATRLQNAAYINNLRKRYVYYYTGLNSEILKFEIKAEYGLFIAEHLLRQYIPGSGTAPGPGADRSPGLLSRIFGSGNPVNPQSPATSSEGKRLVYAESSIPAVQGTGSGVGGASAGDAPVFPHLYSYDNSNNDRQSVSSTPGPNELRRMKFQHVYDQLNYTGPDFQRISMTVRGDPYWFGTSKPVFMQAGFNNRVPGDITRARENRADFFVGQQKFYIEVNSADLATETPTGLANTNRTISGVYTITQCVNRFVGGRFEQELVGVRDLMIHGEKMYNAVQQATIQTVR